MRERGERDRGRERRRGGREREIGVFSEREVREREKGVGGKEKEAVRPEREWRWA